jgi:hypothetical protein
MICAQDDRLPEQAESRVLRRSSEQLALGKRISAAFTSLLSAECALRDVRQ